MRAEGRGRGGAGGSDRPCTERGRPLLARAAGFINRDCSRGVAGWKCKGEWNVRRRADFCSPAPVFLPELQGRFAVRTAFSFMKNLLLLALIIGCAWYFLTARPVAPPPTPVVQAPPPPARVDYSGVRTYYSPLNDPPVSANGRSSVYSSGVVLGGTSAAQRVGGGYNTAPTTSFPAAASPERATSTIGLGGAGNR